MKEINFRSSCYQVLLRLGFILKRAIFDFRKKEDAIKQMSCKRLFGAV